MKLGGFTSEGVTRVQRGVPKQKRTFNTIPEAIYLQWGCNFSLDATIAPALQIDDTLAPPLRIDGFSKKQPLDRLKFTNFCVTHLHA